MNTGSVSTDPSTSLITSLIPFYGDAIEAVLHEGHPHVVVRRVCEHLGLALHAQQAKLKAKPWACVSMIDTQLPGDSQRREIFCIPLRAFPGWLFSINASKVRADLRATLEAYQREAADVLYRHFFEVKHTHPLLQEMIADAVRAELATALPRLIAEHVTPPFIQVVRQELDQRDTERKLLLNQLRQVRKALGVQMDLPDIDTGPSYEDLVDEAAIEFASTSPGAKISQIKKGVSRRDEAVIAAVARLVAKGKLVRDRPGVGARYWVAGTEPKKGAN